MEGGKFQTNWKLNFLFNFLLFFYVDTTSVTGVYMFENFILQNIQIIQLIKYGLPQEKGYD